MSPEQREPETDWMWPGLENWKRVVETQKDRARGIGSGGLEIENGQREQGWTVPVDYKE